MRMAPVTESALTEIVFPRSGDRGGASDRLLAADSWLVSDGWVRGIDRHRLRFFRACVEADGISSWRLRSFWEETLAGLPREGNWFPRVELAAGSPSLLRLRIRPAPPLDTSVRVWVCDEPDPRTTPRRKGPDLTVLAGLRGRAAEHGAQEALLTTRGGLVLEAAGASVLWWEDGTLCLPSPTLRTLPGITIEFVKERARALGVPVRYRRRPVGHLAGREVWLVNALHGIRPVTEWLGADLPAGPAVHAATWQRWLNGNAQPLDGTG